MSLKVTGVNQLIKNLSVLLGCIGLTVVLSPSLSALGMHAEATRKLQFPQHLPSKKASRHGFSAEGVSPSSGLVWGANPAAEPGMGRTTPLVTSLLCKYCVDVRFFSSG